MTEKLYNRLMELPKENLINLMEHSLDSMQAYNGKTIMCAIMDGLGAELIEDGKYKLPSKEEILKNTSDGLPV